MKLQTRELDKSEIIAEVERLNDIFFDLKLSSLEIQYGFGSGLHIDLLWKPMQEPVRFYSEFIKKSIFQGIFKPGVSDLHISDSEKTFEILVCHESDLHLTSERDDIIENFKKAWSGLNVRTHGDAPSSTEQDAAANP